MFNRFRSNTHHAQCLPLCLALVLIGAPSCGSDAPTGGQAAAGATQVAGASGAGAAGQGAGGLPAAAGGASAGTGGATSFGGALVGSGGALVGSGGSLGSGGALGSAGASGGSAGAGTAGGAAADCSSFLLCDDFEGDAPGMGTSPWKLTMGGGYKVEVVSTPVHGGSHAVHVNAPMATGNGYLAATKGFPATDFWGRAYVRVKSAAGGHQCFVALNAASDQVRVLNEMGSGEVATNLRSSDKLNDSSMKVPQDTWFCYEWHQSPTALHVYADGTEVPNTAATWSIASIQSLQIGVMRFQAGTGMADVYFDDVALNTTRVGCN